MSGKKRKIFKTLVVYYIFAIVICILDQISKIWIKMLVAEKATITLIDKVLYFTLVYNRGTAFGMFKEFAYLFSGITAVAIILITFFLAFKKQTLCVVEKISLCFILGGACGNFIDRIRYGYVVDFIDFRVWPVFNLADSFITCGAVILIFSMLLKKNHYKVQEI